MSGIKPNDCYELPIPEEVHDERAISYGFETPGMSREDVIRRNTILLAKCLHYEYKDISHLEAALRVERTNNTARKLHSNSDLATVGESIIRTVVADELFFGSHTCEEKTILKESLESKYHIRRVSRRLGVCHYSYNSEFLFDEALSSNMLPYTKHDRYLEAIAGAIFHDLGFDYCRDWIKKEILQRMFQ